LTVAVTDAAGAPADPASVVLKIKSPAGAISTRAYPGEVARTGVGLFAFNLALAEKGKWLYRWEASAPAQGAQQGDLTVTGSNI